MSSCQRCGTENLAEARVCVSCGSVLAPAPSAWSPTGTQVETYTQYASFLERVGAVILDWLILIIPTAIVARATNPLVSQIVTYAYFVYFTGSSGQTLGKRVLNIKVVKADGSAMEYGSAVLREIVGKFVSGIILGIGFLFPLWDARKQALHDKVASTLVVKSAR